MYFASTILWSLIWGTQVLIVAMGMYLVYSASRTVHVAIGAIGTAAAYALYFGVASGWPLAAAILFGTGLAAVLGLLSAKLLEPFALRQEPLFGLLVSFALVVIIESVIAMLFGTDGKNLQTGVLSVVGAGGLQIDLPGSVTIGIGAVIGLAGWATVHFTKIGRILRSVAENPALAISLGLPNDAVRRAVHVIAAVAAGLVVSLSGWHTALTPQMGFQLVVAGFIALLMGGAGDIRGTILSSYVLAVIPSLIIGYTTEFSENWRLVFVFLIAAIVLAFRPNGIFGKRLREA